MAIRIQSLPKKNFGQPNYNVSFPSWWSFNELQIPQKLESPPQLYHEAKYLGLQLSDQDSSSTQSIGQSHSEIGAVSSESGEDGSCGKGVEEKMKPVFLFSSSSSEISFNSSQADHSHPMARASHLYSDPHFGGLFSPYGPQAAIVQPQMVGMTSARLPLPLDLADDGPIYVNAKQYHGILRRRQTRAKLEAQNKLVKARKPYLHESRHLHALNRVRGSGGRFLSTKKVQQTDTAPNPSRLTVSDSIHSHHKNSGLELESCRSGAGQSGASNASCSDVTSVSNGEILFPKPQEHRFSAISTHVGGGMQDNVGLVRSGTQHRASVVR